MKLHEILLLVGETLDTWEHTFVCNSLDDLRLRRRITAFECDEAKKFFLSLYEADSDMPEYYRKGYGLFGWVPGAAHTSSQFGHDNRIFAVLLAAEIARVGRK